jgi:hypothetical protein
MDRRSRPARKSGSMKTNGQVRKRSFHWWLDEEQKSAACRWMLRQCGRLFVYHTQQVEHQRHIARRMYRRRVVGSGSPEFE